MNKFYTQRYCHHTNLYDIHVRIWGGIKIIQIPKNFTRHHTKIVLFSSHPEKRELLNRSPHLCGRKIYPGKREENHTTFVWLSSLWFLPHSACRIPLLWAIVSCPHRSLSQQLPLFHFSHFNWYPHQCRQHSTPAISAPRWNLALPLFPTCCQQQKQTGTANTRWEKMNFPFFADIVI